MFSLKVDDEIELRLQDLRYAEDFFRLIEQNRVHLGRFMDWESNHRTVENTIEYIKAERINFAKRKLITAQIIYHGEIAGNCGLTIHSWTAGHAEVGYWLGEAYTGKGIASRATKALTDYAFNVLGLHKVILRIITENEKSIALAERLRFKFEGIQIQQAYVHGKHHDMAIYYALADGWQSDTVTEFSYRVDEHIEICLLQPHHAQDLYAVVDANRDYLRAWLPWAKDATLESIEDFIESALQQYEDYDGLQCSILYDGEICGAIGYHYWDLGDGKSEIGYWLAEKFTGKGIMTKAVRALVDYAFAVLELHRIEIGTAVGNRKSSAIPERLGFTHEGIIRSGTEVEGQLTDLNMYAILRHEWKSFDLTPNPSSSDEWF